MVQSLAAPGFNPTNLRDDELSRLLPAGTAVIASIPMLLNTLCAGTDDPQLVALLDHLRLHKSAVVVINTTMERERGTHWITLAIDSPDSKAPVVMGTDSLGTANPDRVVSCARDFLGLLYLQKAIAQNPSRALVVRRLGKLFRFQETCKLGSAGQLSEMQTILDQLIAKVFSVWGQHIPAYLVSRAEKDLKLADLRREASAAPVPGSAQTPKGLALARGLRLLTQPANNSLLRDLHAALILPRVLTQFRDRLDQLRSAAQADMAGADIVAFCGKLLASLPATILDVQQIDSMQRLANEVYSFVFPKHATLVHELRSLRPSLSCVM